MKLVYLVAAGVAISGFALVQLSQSGSCGSASACGVSEAKQKSCCTAGTDGNQCHGQKKACETEAAACCKAKKADEAACHDCASKTVVASAIETVATADLKQWLDDAANVTLVDARSGQWDDGRRIGGALQLAPDSEPDAIAVALPDKAARIVVYCSNTKCPAGGKLAESLVKLGYTGVIKYPEGIDGWVEAGHSVSEPTR